MNDHPEDLDVFKDLPNGAKISWGLNKQPTRGPKGELSISKIVEAAIEIADKDGLAAVSMNRLAGSLGFTTMSLYRYISSKDDLLFLMQDAVCEIPIPPDGEAETDWREEMRAYVRACVQVFREHPWFGDIPITSVPIAPNNLQVIDWALRSMRHFPLNHFEKMSFILLLSSYSRSVGILHRDMDRSILAGNSPETFSGMNYGAALKQLVQPDRYPDLYPIIESGAYTEENEQENTVGNDFDFGLERILDGIAHYLAVKTSGPLDPK
ncbi:TetR family transcriptional regulator [Paenibacillus selenitireducens]|uniref:TetR family transcriptional regulator n=1 Tax=Paenibacillus selenitireducens TaxID=1324314 RepID=A0A1T2XMI8_9BACL|nr:TetR/AcrR family transcriptional regulator [Paenibacillus selenitireducens]OPA81025.1 TetR family transcriptional regulator [Paenibacillus selenitireducens]